ncbi:MAG: hypothetical protein ACK5Q5_07565 [Planctomycetaceae bacterium]
MSSSVSHRVSGYHSMVFHGDGYYLSRKSGPGPWPTVPAVNSENRELLHVIRSGRFVPPVFVAGAMLVVCEAVKAKLTTLPNVDVAPVVFERLVDLPMPDIGDFSAEARNPIAGEVLMAAPDVPELHETIGNYYQVLEFHSYSFKEQYPDYGPVMVNFGTYPGRPGVGKTSPGPVDASLKMLDEYPMVQLGTVHMLREDAFSLLAPFLNLDYFSIASLAIDQRSPEEKEAGRRNWELQMERLRKHASNG